ncbi:MAG: hypothetical protein D6820_16175 [Lentisphaerae bacterium]|nr:MAG: hypothetical protein D6820_16175 [Lentisphaerota bacterium]
MGLDIHVMPLTRFLQGDYESPLERMFGNKVVRIGTARPSASKEEADQFVKMLQDALSRKFNTSITWHDDGDVVFSEQFDFRAWHALRAYAAHQEYPATKGIFRKTERRYWQEENPEEHPGLMKIAKSAQSRFMHLVYHGDNCGYYFPADFDPPCVIDPERAMIVGSSVRLLAELEMLNKSIGMKRNLGDLKEGEAIASDDDPDGALKFGWAFMHHCATLSVEHKLPIIFDG